MDIAGLDLRVIDDKGQPFDPDTIPENQRTNRVGIIFTTKETSASPEEAVNTASDDELLEIASVVENPFRFHDGSI